VVLKIICVIWQYGVTQQTYQAHGSLSPPPMKCHIIGITSHAEC